jgi:DNA-binding response OmpR family regulator
MSRAMSALLIEDDDRLARFTCDYLSQHEVSVVHARDGESGLQEALRRPYDVVILDLMLPGRDGVSVCRALRARSAVPIVMLTARNEEADRVLGLEMGADDYVTKPYSPRELLARVRALVRRQRGELGPPVATLHVGPLEVHPSTRRALLSGSELLLTTYEFNLLLAFAQQPGRVFSREQLIDLVRGNAEEAFERSVDVHVCRLRTKLAAARQDTALSIKTVRGVGYMLATESPG